MRGARDRDVQAAAGLGSGRVGLGGGVGDEHVVELQALAALHVGHVDAGLEGELAAEDEAGLGQIGEEGVERAGGVFAAGDDRHRGAGLARAAGDLAAALRFLDEARVQAQAWLERVGLGGFGDRYPHQLSGGMRKRTSLAQVLALDPDIILMDEPFSALDIQTRQLMENEVLALWAAKKKAVLFITHDLDEAIAMSDRVVVLSAGPASRPIGEFRVDLERPRDVAEVRATPRFVELHQAIWGVLRDEVLKGYQQQLAA